jgi:hypothetical protein
MIIIIIRGENFVAHLDGLGGTPVCRGTPVAHHWYRPFPSVSPTIKNMAGLNLETLRPEGFWNKTSPWLDAWNDHFQPFMWRDASSQGLRYACRLPTIFDHHWFVNSVVILLLKVWGLTQQDHCVWADYFFCYSGQQRKNERECNFNISDRPDDGGSKDLWNVGKLLPDYTALQPRRQPSSLQKSLQADISRTLCFNGASGRGLFEVTVLEELKETTFNIRPG